MLPRNYTKVLAGLLMCCLFFSCGDNNDPIEPSKSITVYGTVLNSKTHEPVTGAEVIIGAQQSISGTSYWTDISSSVSGSDGQYELQFNAVDNAMFYYIKVNSSGYVSYSSRTTFGDGGGTYRMDLNIQPK